MQINLDQFNISTNTNFSSIKQYLKKKNQTKNEEKQILYKLFTKMKNKCK